MPPVCRKTRYRRKTSAWRATALLKPQPTETCSLSSLPLMRARQDPRRLPSLHRSRLSGSLVALMETPSSRTRRSATHPPRPRDSPSTPVTAAVSRDASLSLPRYPTTFPRQLATSKMTESLLDESTAASFRVMSRTLRLRIAVSTRLVSLLPRLVAISERTAEALTFYRRLRMPPRKMSRLQDCRLPGDRRLSVVPTRLGPLHAQRLVHAVTKACIQATVLLLLDPR